MTVRVSDICADFDPVVFGLGEKCRASGGPIRINLVDVSHADIHERACTIGVTWGCQRHGRFVVSRASADVENDPAVGHPEDDRVALADSLPSNTD